MQACARLPRTPGRSPPWERRGPCRLLPPPSRLPALPPPAGFRSEAAAPAELELAPGVACCALPGEPRDTRKRPPSKPKPPRSRRAAKIEPGNDGQGCKRSCHFESPNVRADGSHSRALCARTYEGAWRAARAWPLSPTSVLAPRFPRELRGPGRGDGGSSAGYRVANCARERPRRRVSPTLARGVTSRRAPRRTTDTTHSNAESAN